MARRTLAWTLGWALLLGCGDSKGNDKGKDTNAGANVVDDSDDDTDPGNETDDTDDTDTVIESGPGSIRGRVVSTDGAGVGGVTVVSGPASAVTDNAGFFYMMDVPETEEGNIQVTTPRWSPSYRPIVVPPLGDASTLITTLRTTERRTINGADGGAVEAAGAEVILPADGVVNGAGAPVKGDVVVEFVLLDDYDSFRATPGSQFDDGKGPLGALRTFGQLNVRLWNPNGNPLQLAGSMRLKIPYSDEGGGPNGGQKVDTWWFDETTGLWVKEGTVNADGARATLDVDRLGWWNLAVARDDLPSCINGAIRVGGAGGPIPYGMVTLTSQAGAEPSFHAVTTDFQGRFCLPSYRASFFMEAYGVVDDLPRYIGLDVDTFVVGEKAEAECGGGGVCIVSLDGGLICADHRETFCLSGTAEAGESWFSMYDDKDELLEHIQVVLDKPGDFCITVPVETDRVVCGPPGFEFSTRNVKGTGAVACALGGACEVLGDVGANCLVPPSY